MHDKLDIKAESLGNGVKTRGVPTIAQKASIRLNETYFHWVLKREKGTWGKQVDHATDPNQLNK